VVNYRSICGEFDSIDFRIEITQAEAAEAATALRINENAFKQSFARFGVSFRAKPSQRSQELVSPDESEIDAEIKHLIPIFSQAKT
jgi:hypothetical protein